MSRFESYLGKYWHKNAIMDRYREYAGVPYTPPDKNWLRDGHIEDPAKSDEWNRQFVEQNHAEWVKARNSLQRKRDKTWKEVQEMVRFYIWDELERKLSDGDIDRLFEKWRERYMGDGFKYFLSMVDAEIEEIKAMDWFQDKPDYEYV